MFRSRVQSPVKPQGLKYPTKNMDHYALRIAEPEIYKRRNRLGGWWVASKTLLGYVILLGHRPLHHYVAAQWSISLHDLGRTLD